jgi:hypothetical protein
MFVGPSVVASAHADIRSPSEATSVVVAKSSMANVFFDLSQQQTLENALRRTTTNVPPLE